MEYFYVYVKNICVFTLMISLLLNLFPDAKYKRYIKLFAGMLLIALVFNPIVQWKNAKIDVEKIIKKYANGLLDIEWRLDTKELETKMMERTGKNGLEENREN